MRTYTTLIAFLATASIAACADDPDTTSEVTGAMRYQDAATEHDGTAREPASPPPQTATVTVEVRGTGDLSGLDPQCALDGASGEFHALYTGEADVSDDGVYLAGLAASDARIETLSGCVIPDLTVGLITDVVVRAELDYTTQNCETYCAASARADAEAECGATADAAACRADAESQLEASCTTTCTEEQRQVVAEVSLGASFLGEVDAEALRAAAFGQMAVDLTFDRAE
jgi:hypothetical protein